MAPVKGSITKKPRPPCHQIPKIPLIQLGFEAENVGLIAGFLNDHLIARRPHVSGMPEGGHDGRRRLQDRLARPEIGDGDLGCRRLGGNRDAPRPFMKDGGAADQAQTPNNNTDQ